jgi:hypothetical protein
MKATANIRSEPDGTAGSVSGGIAHFADSQYQFLAWLGYFSNSQLCVLLTAYGYYDIVKHSCKFLCKVCVWKSMLSFRGHADEVTAGDLNDERRRLPDMHDSDSCLAAFPLRRTFRGRRAVWPTLAIPQPSPSPRRGVRSLRSATSSQTPRPRPSRWYPTCVRTMTKLSSASFIRGQAPWRGTCVPSRHPGTIFTCCAATSKLSRRISVSSTTRHHPTR